MSQPSTAAVNHYTYLHTQREREREQIIDRVRQLLVAEQNSVCHLTVCLECTYQSLFLARDIRLQEQTGIYGNPHLPFTLHTHPGSCQLIVDLIHHLDLSVMVAGTQRTQLQWTHRP